MRLEVLISFLFETSIIFQKQSVFHGSNLDMMFLSSVNKYKRQEDQRMVFKFEAEVWTPPLHRSMDNGVKLGHRGLICRHASNVKGYIWDNGEIIWKLG